MAIARIHSSTLPSVHQLLGDARKFVQECDPASPIATLQRSFYLIDKAEIDQRSAHSAQDPGTIARVRVLVLPNQLLHFNSAHNGIQDICYTVVSTVPHRTLSPRTFGIGVPPAARVLTLAIAYRIFSLEFPNVIGTARELHALSIYHPLLRYSERDYYALRAQYPNLPAPVTLPDEEAVGKQLKRGTDTAMQIFHAVGEKYFSLGCDVLIDLAQQKVRKVSAHIEKAWPELSTRSKYSSHETPLDILESYLMPFPSHCMKS